MLNRLLEDKKLVLASSSPRRKEIFTMLNLKPIILSPDIDEPIEDKPPHKIVQLHAGLKAAAIAGRFDSNTVIVAADTLVYINGKMLGKPDNSDEAQNFLELISGNSHTVYTGVCIYWKNNKITGYAKSKVYFKKLSSQEIIDYIRTGEPLDKAGAYGIQGYGSQFIKEIRGCYFNVMGFPVNLFYTMLTGLMSGTLS